MIEPNDTAAETPLKRTPLYDLHVELGARMVPFAGYAMPVNYPSGVIKEHTHARQAAGLFDVSHMGQCFISGPDWQTTARAIETLVPADVLGLKPGQQRYSQLLNESGGIVPEAAEMGFMRYIATIAESVPLHISRSGYTGEDGYEISLPAQDATSFCRRLLADPRVKPIGLGARDTLRLEAGLCLYGHDIDETTSPAEADLLWSVGKRRRAEGGFPGAPRVLREIASGTARRRVGLRLEGRAPAREGCEIHGSDGTPLGVVTSGSFAPSLGGPIAMGYVETASASLGTALSIVIRGVAHPATVVSLPFVPNRYHRKKPPGASHG